jgi:hypothetical protein
MNDHSNFIVARPTVCHVAIIKDIALDLLSPQHTFISVLSPTIYPLPGPFNPTAVPFKLNR